MNLNRLLNGTVAVGVNIMAIIVILIFVSEDPSTTTYLIIGVFIIPVLVMNTYVIYKTFTPEAYDESEATAAANTPADRSPRE